MAPGSLRTARPARLTRTQPQHGHASHVLGSHQLAQISPGTSRSFAHHSHTSSREYHCPVDLPRTSHDLGLSPTRPDDPGASQVQPLLAQATSAIPVLLKQCLRRANQANPGQSHACEASPAPVWASHVLVIVELAPSHPDHLF